MSCGLQNTTKIYITLFLTLCLMISELVVGYTYNSNTLVADSFHMFSDAVSFVVSLIAIYKKPQETNKARKTFGYRRAEQVGAMIHGSLLLGLSFSVGTAAILRIVEPEKIDNPKLALIVGSTGIIVDVTGIALFFQDYLQDGSMNIRSLFLEKLGDLAGTIVVIITCTVSYIYDDPEKYPWVEYVDPVGTLLFCCVLLWATREIFHMVIRIVMQDAPRGFPMEEFEQEIKNLKVEIIKNNVWQVDNHEVIMSIVVKTDTDQTEISSKVKKVFRDFASKEFSILNMTVEVVNGSDTLANGNLSLPGYENKSGLAIDDGDVV